MSYLLDALRKSEAQRRLGQTPGLEITPTAPAADRRSRKGLLSVMLLLVVGMGVFFLWREILIPPTAPEPVAQAPEVEDATDDARPPPEPEAVAAADEAPEPAAEDTAQATRPDTDLEALREEARRRREAFIRDRATAAPEPEPEPEQTATAPEPEEAPAIAAEPELEEAPVAAGQDDPQSDERRGAEFLHAWELPATIRSELPPLEVMAHIYSDDPKNRFVLINGRRYGEGDDLGQGATLAEIRREGAIVDFREYRFLLGNP